MKYLTALLLCSVIILSGCGSKQDDTKEQVQEVTEEQLKEIIETINEIRDKQRELFDYALNPEDIFVENSMTFVKCVGKNNTFSDVCREMQDLCSPEVVEKHMHEMDLYIFDGEIYFHAAGGLPSYDKIEDLSDITVLAVKDDIIVLSIKRYYFLSDDKDDYIVSKYVVKFRNGRAYILGYEENYSYVVNTRNS